MKNKIEEWIGLEIPMVNTTIKVCIGLNIDDGMEVSFASSEDIEAGNAQGFCPWNFSNPNIGEIKISVAKGDKRVFDNDHNLINPKTL